VKESKITELSYYVERSEFIHDNSIKYTMGSQEEKKITKIAFIHM